MSKKRKNKRDASKQRPEKGGAGVRPQAAGESTEAYEERRARQKMEWAAQKKQRERKPLPVALYAWIATGGAGIAAVVVVAFLLLSGGGSGGSPEPTPTLDPRVSDQPIAETIEIDAVGAESGSTFDPASIRGPAGEVIEILITNVGTVSHAMRVSGPDGEYGDEQVPGDDFVAEPFAIKPGETGRVLVKIDEPGSYPFQCDFHPDTQKGTLILE
jgi:plastocyanin